MFEGLACVLEPDAQPVGRNYAYNLIPSLTSRAGLGMRTAGKRQDQKTRTNWDRLRERVILWSIGGTKICCKTRQIQNDRIPETKSPPGGANLWKGSQIAKLQIPRDPMHRHLAKFRKKSTNPLGKVNLPWRCPKTLKNTKFHNQKIPRPETRENRPYCCTIPGHRVCDCSELDSRA